MGSIVNYASQRATSVFTELRFVLLPKGTRVPTVYTITAGTAASAISSLTLSAAAAVKGATTLTLASTATIPAFSKITFANGISVRTASAVSAATSVPLLYPLIDGIPASTTGSVAASVLTAGSTNLPVTALPTNLYPGEKLVFDVGGTPKTVVVSDFAPAGSIAVECQPLAVTVVANNTASTFATLYIAGATDASPSSAPKNVDGSNFLSGAGSEMITTGTSRTMSFTTQRVVGDPGCDLLMRMLYDDAYYDREIYATLKRPYGEEYAGAAILTSGNQSSPVQDLITLQADLQFQGSSFTYVAPTGAFNPATGAYSPPQGA
jgi:hypothetical protein